MQTFDVNASQKDLCGWYRVQEAELIVAKPGSGKNDYVRLSMLKVKNNGKLDRKGFSHYFNVGIPNLVNDLKAAGVTDKGISEENLKKALEGDDEDLFNWYGFWYLMPFGGTYKHNESGNVASETLIFVPCDEDTSVPKKDWAPTQRRLNDILSNYTKVDTKPAEEEAPKDNTDAEFEEFMRMKKAGQL